jgi:CPA1 family monovalent cation:H+ antiporter
MALGIERIEILLLVAAVVAMAARRLRLPYTVGLVIAGVALAFSPIGLHPTLTKNLIFSAFLPPLIFEAAFQIPWAHLRRELSILIVLATAGVLLAAAITAAGLHWLLGWEWPPAILLGILIAATDPVSVIALFKDIHVEGRLKLLVEAESLFNDGTVAVLFGVALVAMSGGNVQPLSVAGGFIITVAGGLVVGGLTGGLLLLLAGHTDDHLVEITFSTVAAYGSFLLAEHFHMSGVLATMTAGIVLGNVGSLGSITDKGREAVESFWEYVAFAVNSLVFLLIGISLTHERVPNLVVPALVTIGLVLLGRAAAVYAGCALFARSRLRVSHTHQHLLFWGGLRGALALALALGLPADLPHRQSIVTLTFAVVAFSVVVQGLTMSPLLHRLGEAAPLHGKGGAN